VPFTPPKLSQGQGCGIIEERDSSLAEKLDISQDVTMLTSILYTAAISSMCERIDIKINYLDL